MKEPDQKQLDRIKSEKNIFTQSQLLFHFRKNTALRAKEIAEYLEIVPAEFSAVLRLRTIPEIVRDGYYAGLISLTHLNILSRLKREEDMINAYEQILENSMTTFQTEELVREYLYNVASEGERLTQDEQNDLLEKLSKIDKSISPKVVQTRIRTQLTMTVQGDLKKTTSILRKIIDKI